MRSLLVAALLLLSCSSSVRVTDPNSVQPPSTRYLAIGDSYTIGQSVPAIDSFPVQFAAALRASGSDVGQPKIIARTGWTTAEIAEAVERDGVRGPFQLVTLLAGVNDQYQGFSAGDYRQQFVPLLRRAIELAGGEPQRVIVISIPDWGATPFAEGRDRAGVGREIDAFNRINLEEARRAGTRYVDITEESRHARTNPSLVAPDGLHPSAAMYGEWVAALLSAG
ncbi:MAG: SGNH/GDSL hydrolase family protein [Acidobacteriota bacterium]